jgi:hypothetical protein
MYGGIHALSGIVEAGPKVVADCTAREEGARLEDRILQ